MSVIDVTGGASHTTSVLLPSGRTNYLLDNILRRSHLTVKGILLWLDFSWSVAEAATHLIPQCNFYMMKSQEDEAAVQPGTYDPYVQPAPPGNMTAWTDFPTDGLDAFLWTHWIAGNLGPNSVIFNTGGGASGNEALNMTGTAQVAGARTFFVSQEWQPSVVVKTRRRLERDEGLILGMFTGNGPTNTGQTGTNTSAQLTWRARVIAG